MPHLPNGHQVILREFGHTSDLWTEQTRASTHLINTFAIVGGWLGFHAGADMLALVTTIAGAAAATNLALILVGIGRERALRPRPVPERPMVGAGAAR